MQKSGELDYLTHEEFTELSDFLMSVHLPDECLEISGLHGFFTALLIGPELVMPNDWLPEIFAQTEDDMPIFSSFEEEKRIIDLIIRFYNQTVMELRDIENYEPLLYMTEHEGKTYYSIEDWCFGFMRAVEFCSDAWAPLTNSEFGKELLTIPFLFGTSNGLETLMEMEQEGYVDAEFVQGAVFLLSDIVRTVFQYWKEHRDRPKFLH